MNKNALKLAIFLDSDYQMMATSIDLSHDGKKSPVETIGSGLVGITPGCSQWKVSVSGAVLSSGLEYNVLGKSDSSDVVTVAIPIGDKTFSGEGQIMNASLKYSVNGSAEYNFEWNGTGKVS